MRVGKQGLILSAALQLDSGAAGSDGHGVLAGRSAWGQLLGRVSTAPGAQGLRAALSWGGSVLPAGLQLRNPH